MGLIDGLESIVRENEPLAPYTRLRLGGVAEYFAEPTTVDQLRAIVRRFSDAQLPIRLLGGGTNVLVRDEGAAGLVLRLSAPPFNRIEVDGNRITAGGGAQLSHVISIAVREGLAGPENLVGIPGSIGGALHCNTGAAGQDVGSWTQRATVLTRKGEILQREKSDMNFSYRRSSLNELAILQVEFELESDDPVSLTRRMQKTWIVRKSNQPRIEENSAYIFLDHGGQSAAELIEMAGLRGTRIGHVEICATDANFFVAAPGASSSDVLRLIELVKTQVADRLSVELELGLQIW